MEENNNNNSWEELQDWIDFGVNKKWITPGFCYTHDGDPYMTEEEEQEWDDGGDPCLPVFKYIANN